VIVNIRDNKAFYGEAMILGKPYITGYDPIRDSANRYPVSPSFWASPMRCSLPVAPFGISLRKMTFRGVL
jgi:hypothetical protein